MTDFRTSVLLSLQRTLWEQVTADLRGVAVGISGDDENGAINARFLFEGDVGELQNECCSLAETYCIADFREGVEVAFRAVPRAGRELLDGEEWLYLRWEPSD